jgi:hypothetical protein
MRTFSRHQEGKKLLRACSVQYLVEWYWASFHTSESACHATHSPFHLPPRSATPVGLVDPGPFFEGDGGVTLEISVIAGLNEISATAGPFRTLALQRIGRSVLIQGPIKGDGVASVTNPDHAVIARIVLQGHECRIVVHDASSLGSIELMRLLVAAAPQSGEDFDLTDEAMLHAIEKSLLREVGAENKSILRKRRLYSIAEAASLALIAGDAAPWLHSPGFNATFVYTTADEPKWDAAARDVTNAAASRLLLALGKRCGPEDRRQLIKSAASVQRHIGPWDSLITAQIGGIGVSVVDASPREVLYFRASDIAATVASSATDIVTSLRIGDAGVDDTSSTAEFPAVLCRAKSNAQSAEPVLAVRIKTARNSSMVSSVRNKGTRDDRGFRVLQASVALQPLRICVSARFLLSALRSINAITIAVSTRVAPRGRLLLDEAARDTMDSELLQLVSAAALCACSKLIVGHNNDIRLYVQELQDVEFKVLVDVRLMPQLTALLEEARLLSYLPRWTTPFIPMLSAVTVTGAALVFKLRGLGYKVGSAADLLSLCSTPLQEQATKQIFSVLSSIDGIGAPLAVAKAVEEGAKRAGSGARDGGVKGAIVGVAGAASNTAAAVLGATSSISSLFGSAAAAVSNMGASKEDKAAAAAAAEATSSKPTDVAGGAKQAAGRFIGGFVSGAKGLVSKVLTSHL